MTHTDCNPSSLKAEGGKLLWVQGQFWLQCETLSQQKTTWATDKANQSCLDWFLAPCLIVNSFSLSHLTQHISGFYWICASQLENLGYMWTKTIFILSMLMISWLIFSTVCRIEHIYIFYPDICLLETPLQWFLY